MAKVTTVCYGRTREWSSRKKAMEFFWEGILCCDGAERDRYITIYAQLKEGCDVATDEEDYF